MTETQVAWLAGLLEGEGSFYFAPPSSKYKATVGISIQMTDEDVIAKVAQFFGNKYSRSNRNLEKWKPVFSTAIRGRRAILIMKMILPYMGERRTRRINEVISSAISKSDKYTPKVTKNISFIIIKHHLAGESARSIGRKLGLHHETVCKVIRKHLDTLKVDKV